MFRISPSRALAAAGISFAAAVTAGTLIAAHPAAQPPQVISAASITAAHAIAPHVTPAERACRQFTRWEAAPTYANLRELVTDSFTVRGGHPGLASDIGQLYANARGGGDIDTTDSYIADDCGLGGM